jgi:hypothetical protein
MDVAPLFARTLEREYKRQNATRVLPNLFYGLEERLKLTVKYLATRPGFMHMLLQDITLAGDASSSRIYSWKSPISPGGILRINSSAPVGLPETLSVNHTESKQGGLPLDRHLVRLDLSKSTALGVVVRGSFYVVMEVPRDPIFTAAMLKDMKTQMVNLLAVSGNMDKLIAGEP